MQLLFTHYDELQIDSNANLDIVRAAYRRLSQKHHPDKHPEENKAAAESRMKAINRAYTVLSDPNRRQEYDLWLSKTEKLNAYRTSPTVNSGRNVRNSGETNSKLFDIFLTYIKQDGSYFKIEVDSATTACAIEETKDFWKIKNPLYLHLFTKRGDTLLEENNIPDYPEEVIAVMTESIAIQRVIAEHEQHLATLESNLARKLSENFVKGTNYHTISQQELSCLGDINSRLSGFRAMLNDRLDSLKSKQVHITLTELENKSETIRSYARYYESLRQIYKERGGRFATYYLGNRPQRKRISHLLV